MADKEILQPQSTTGIQPAANDYNVGEESVGLAPQDEGLFLGQRQCKFAENLDDISAGGRGRHGHI